MRSITDIEHFIYIYIYIFIYIYIYIYVYINSFAQAGCDTMSVFKQSFTGLNSEVFFLTGWQTNVKSQVCPTIYP